MKPRVLILGGGFSGLTCALSLSAREFDVVLVDQRRHFEFLPGIHELLSQQKTKKALRLPLKRVLAADGHRFQRGHVTDINARERVVTLGEKRLSYDYLVVALGSADSDFGVSGVTAHAYPFKSVDQCAAIGQSLRNLHKLDKASRVVIVGGGFEGMEAAGEILRRYRDSKISVTIVEAADRLLPGSVAAVSEHLSSLCERAGFEVLLGQSVTRVMPKTVALADGSRLRSDLTIWTGGAVAQPFLASTSLSSDDERWLPTSPTLAQPSDGRVFVVGDTAGLAQDLAKQAYHAMDMGAHCATNLKRAAGGRKLLRFKPSGKPQLLAFGDEDTLLIHPRFTVAGPSLGLLKEGIYQAVMAGLDQGDPLGRLRGLLNRGDSLRSSLFWPRWSLKDLKRFSRVRRLA